MRLNVEMSEMPPEYSVEREGAKANINVYTDIQPVQREDASAWKAILWTMQVPYQPDLTERVASDPDKWLETIKRVTEHEEAAATKAQEKDDAMRNIVDTTTVMSIAFVTMAENGTIDEVTAAEHTALFLDWLENTKYDVNAIRKRGDDLYQCIQAHTSQSDRKPENVPALWKHIGDPAVEYNPWSAPHGAHDAYDLGAKVEHNGKRWISDMNGNAYEPGVAAWTEVE